MDLEKFEKMLHLVKKDLESEHGERRDYNTQLRKRKENIFDHEALKISAKTMLIRFIPELEVRMKNLMVLATKNLPDHQELFTITHTKIGLGLSLGEAISVLQHILEIIQIEKSSETKIKERRIFESAEDKLEQANLSFQKEDYPSTLHNLGTALELILKDKLEIPTTITKINTSRIIDILVKHEVQTHPYLTEAKKHIVRIDNKIKHQGYSPSKIDCINGIKVMEELIAKLRDKEIKLSEEIRNKIYEGL